MHMGRRVQKPKHGSGIGLWVLLLTGGCFQVNQTAVIGPISDYLSSSICCKFVYLTVGPKNRGINDEVNLYSIC